MPYLSGGTFSGINTNTDARRIKPNKDTDGVFEAVEMINMDLVGDGAMITSMGYEEVSHITGTGGVKNLLNYEKDETNRYLIITHDDDHYAITPSDTTWDNSVLGDYGTAATNVGGVVFMGSSATRRAILGNDTTANTTKKADLSAAMADLAGTPPDGYIMAEFMGFLFIANGVTVYYSAAEDEDDFAGGGSINFNDIVTGMWVEGKRLIVFTRTYHQGIYFEYDDTWNLSTPLKETYKRQFGCLAHKTIQGTGSDVYYWSPRGVMKLGAELSYNDQGLPRPQSQSENIEKSLEGINWAYRAKATAVFWGEKQQYWLATPYGTSTVPDMCWVYWDSYNTWTTRSGFYPGDLELFRDSNYKNELYFGDANNPYLYKFNEDYSYDGAGYTRKWKSKIFTMGTGIQTKVFKQIDITGSMDTGTEFYVTLDVDGTKKKYKIDNTFLIKNSYSEYIGDNIYGDNWIGGDAPSESRFKRFYAPLNFDKVIREGMELQITIENDEPEQPFKIDFIGIDYDYRPKKQVPGRKYVNTQVST